MAMEVVEGTKAFVAGSLPSLVTLPILLTYSPLHLPTVTREWLQGSLTSDPWVGALEIDVYVTCRSDELKRGFWRERIQWEVKVGLCSGA